MSVTPPEDIEKSKHVVQMVLPERTCAPLAKLHSPRKRSSPRVPSGYTSEDDLSLNVNDALWAEFLANLNLFVDLYMQEQLTTDIANAIHRQISAFKTLERSMHGALFCSFFVLDDSCVVQRAFYVGCLHQLINPHVVYKKMAGGSL